MFQAKRKNLKTRKISQHPLLVFNTASAWVYHGNIKATLLTEDFSQCIKRSKLRTYKNMKWKFKCLSKEKLTKNFIITGTEPSFRPQVCPTWAVFLLLVDTEYLQEYLMIFFPRYRIIMFKYKTWHEIAKVWWLVFHQNVLSHSRCLFLSVGQ